LLGLAEIFITVFFAVVFLGETLSATQIIGGVLLAVSLILVGLDKIPPQKRYTTGWLSWLNPPKIPAADLNWNS